MSKDVLKERGITHILTCALGIKPVFPEDFEYKSMPMLDKATVGILKFIEEGCNFLKDCFEKEGKALVHCFVGKSRSTTIVIGYLMKEKKMNLKDSLELVKSKWEIADPNVGFLLQLKALEMHLFGQNSEV